MRIKGLKKPRRFRWDSDRDYARRCASVEHSLAQMLLARVAEEDLLHIFHVGRKGRCQLPHEPRAQPSIDPGAFPLQQYKFG